MRFSREHHGEHTAAAWPPLAPTDLPTDVELNYDVASARCGTGRRDKDGSGEISLGELTSVLNATAAINELRRQLAAGSKKLVERFREWDMDGNGDVDRAEFARALMACGLNLHETQIGAMFDSIDADASGTISFKELNRALRRNPALEAAKVRPLSMLNSACTLYVCTLLIAVGALCLVQAAKRAAARAEEQEPTEELVDVAALRSDMPRVMKEVAERCDANAGLMAAKSHSHPSQRWQWAKAQVSSLEQKCPLCNDEFPMCA